jgi:signal transduction histidine kinase
MLDRNMHRISALARDLLVFSRGEPPKPELVAPAGLVREVADLFRDLAGQQGIRLEVDIPAEPQPAALDPAGLHDCLSNLVANACDACAVSPGDGHVIRMGLREQDGVLVFEVEDSGCGMDNEVKKKAFTSFFTTKGGGGTGLGLLTTRKIVQQHGGAIDFETAAGEGTTFRLRFPRERLPEPLPAGSEATTSARDER